MVVGLHNICFRFPYLFVWFPCLRLGLRDRRTLNPLHGKNRLRSSFTLNGRPGIQSNRPTDRKPIGRPLRTSDYAAMLPPPIEQADGPQIYCAAKIACADPLPSMHDGASTRTDRRTLNLVGGHFGLRSAAAASAAASSNRAGRQTLNILRGQNRLRRRFTLNARLVIQSSRPTDPKPNYSATTSNYAPQHSILPSSSHSHLCIHRSSFIRSSSIRIHFLQCSCINIHHRP